MSEVLKMSKKLFALFALPAVLLSTSALATTAPKAEGFTGAVATQGFNGPFQGIKTVAEALNGSDDTPVALTGHITKSFGGEMYQFVDSTGTISIEIDHKKWRGLSVTPETKITIYGEIEKDFAASPEIDVNSVKLAG